MKRLAFSDDMMRALAAGEKTMTRRPIRNVSQGYDGATIPDWDAVKSRLREGDLVAATCAFCKSTTFDADGDEYVTTTYRYRMIGEGNAMQFSPARIMPAALAPFVLRVTEVRAEKLGDISEQDARREGAVAWFESVTGRSAAAENICAGDCFAELWCHVYGANAWDDGFNSWVWVYGFEIAERRI